MMVDIWIDLLNIRNVFDSLLSFQMQVNNKYIYFLILIFLKKLLHPLSKVSWTNLLLR